MSTLPADIRTFLAEYPEAKDNTSQRANIEFYENKKKCRPDKKLISEIHDEWLGDYRTLEYNHGFIQWLFPIQEHGMNYQSQPLQRHEIAAMKSSGEIMRRVMDSYKLMLDFYGMRLLDEQTGLLGRVNPPRNYSTRYNNLCRSSHNNLRISRILKCLAELGLERLNAGFLLHVLNEQSENGELITNSILSSMDRWWANCIRADDERRVVGEFIARAREGEWIFTRKMYEEMLERRNKGLGLSLKP